MSENSSIGQVQPAEGLRAERATSVQQAIANAADRTSVEFDFLLAKAQLESALDPKAKARTSSASGLFQFIESTWLETMKRHGPRFGLGDISAQISVSSTGRASVSDPGQRQAILALRNDPQISSYMAAGFAEDNRAQLLPVLGREPHSSEMYLAHFLGAGGASKFLGAMQSNPNQSAADLFPRPAAANRPVFYNRDGSDRSLAEVLQLFDGKLDRAMARTPQDIPISPGIPTGSPPTIAYTNYPRIEPRATLAIGQGAGPAPESTRPSMSQVLANTFGASETGAAGTQIRRAYDQFKAFGL
ncbi:MAG: transglycosylase SLT domain-containing protein [Pseudomonadota bacterium]